MKRILFSLFFAVMAAMTVNAQQIAVVFEGGSMRTCSTLLQAVRNATDGCVIYLPAGGFQIGDTVRINHRVSIIGLNHKANSENADGMTTISGNLFFDEGSSGSVVMGCYISGSAMIGYDEKSVHNIFFRYCNLGSIQVKSNLCTGTTVNQCYIRYGSNFNGADGILTHNVMHSICGMTGGVISNNIITSCYEYYTLQYVNNVTIANNVIFEIRSSYLFSGGNCQIINNMLKGNDFGDDCVNISAEWSDVFNEPTPGISSNSNFHFKEGFKDYESKVGLYAGKSPNAIKYFNDDALPPVPYVQAKDIPESTNIDGMLNVKLTVKDGNK